jgi:hypothetical protein
MANRVQPKSDPPDVIEVLRQIHTEQAARGYVPRTAEEIDADTAASRQDDADYEAMIEQARRKI